MANMRIIDDQKSNTIALWDRIGIGASALCLVHCLITSLLLGVLPFLNLSFVLDHRIHQGLALFIAATCGFALVPAFRRHRRAVPLTIAAVGVALLLAAAFLTHAVIAHTLETPLTVLGGLLMASAHFLNMMLSHRCDAC